MLGLLAITVLGGCNRQARGPGGAKQVVVGVSLLNLSSEFIVMLNEAMEAKAGELGVKLLVNDAQRSAERQIQQVEGFIAQKVDVIILNPCEVDASSPAVDKALAAGIPIINLNSATQSVPTAFVGSRDEESARIAMEYIAKRLNGQGNVVMMQGFMGQAAQLQRDQGAREVLATHPALKLLACQSAEWDRAKAMSLMENWIQAHGTQINAVFAQNDRMAMGVMRAARDGDIKIPSQLAVIGVDDMPLSSYFDPPLTTMQQDMPRIGQEATRMLLDIIQKKNPAVRELKLSAQLVVRRSTSERGGE